eukprot:TRINITY_DN7894_c0_g1_i2.p1 TRINITY_DN7894_c0_g1~~TRINITY_DN7894_c0_g1_i2.p1  ORF type:complete len:274 (+),score=25.43 TRINITY_DN7894_c0_g1_i2:93-824(+)
MVDDGGSASFTVSQLTDPSQPLSTQSDGHPDHRNSTSCLYFSLMVHWRNEASAPDLLPYQAAVVTRVADLLQKTMGLTLANSVVGCTLSYGVDALVSCERERMRYMLIEYLRVRLAKIERLSEWLSLPANEAARAKMSTAEQSFLHQFTDASKPLMGAVLAPCDEIPPELAAIEGMVGRRPVRAPPVTQAVFVQFRSDLGTIKLGPPDDPSSAIDAAVKIGDLFIARYDSVREWVESGAAVLL